MRKLRMPGEREKGKAVLLFSSTLRVPYHIESVVADAIPSA